MPIVVAHHEGLGAIWRCTAPHEGRRQTLPRKRQLYRKLGSRNTLRFDLGIMK
jgi:hypothetical protein